MCRIKLVLSGRPSVIAEERAEDPKTAFDLAMPKVARVLEKIREKHDLAVRQRHRGKGVAPAIRETARSGRSASTGHEDPGETMGEVIGRRVGRSTTALDRALARPEKARRDAYLNTADPGISETERKAGGGSTARRNTKAKPRRSAAALEDSRGKPSRKSTRRSTNRAKQSQTKEYASRAAVNTPSARHDRGIASSGPVPRRR